MDLFWGYPETLEVKEKVSLHSQAGSPLTAEGTEVMDGISPAQHSEGDSGFRAAISTVHV